MSTKNEKITKLHELSVKLKTKFVGISETIDSLIESITPWYVTPELLERPVVISLWGLTGTGKTSVVRDLIEFLEIDHEALFFDCGAEENTDNSISDKISSFLVKDGNGPRGDYSSREVLSPVFIFDEFQYSRTIDEDGREVSKSSQRSIWNLLDSGILDYVVRSWEIKDLLTFTEELGVLVDEFGPDLKITKGTWPETVIPRIKETLDFYASWDDRDDDDKNTILLKSKRETLVSRLNVVSRGLGYKAIKKLESLRTIGEFSGLLQEYTKEISKPKRIDCSKALVFIIGNLDEAFKGHSDFDPDMNADVFAKITKKTCITDIKEALKSRFRVEQISRLGSNMIVYPSLCVNDFKEIIERELTRIFDRFKETSGIEIKATESFKDLIYMEGVVPSQGVRPLLTTIGTACLPKLSKILSDLDGKTTKVELDVEGDLKSDSVVVKIVSDQGVIRVPEKLKIGSLRSGGACKKLAAHAIHEAGHAIMMTLAKQEIPEMILAQSPLGGGYTYGKLEDTDRQSAMTKNEVISEIKIGLAGIAAEHLFFEDSMCTVGCTQDYQDTWLTAVKAAYHGGLFNDPFPWQCIHAGPEGLPTGATDLDNSRITGKLKDLFEDTYSDVTRDLESERPLLKEIALYLVENRCMLPDTYKEYLESYGSEKIRKIGAIANQGNYWLDAIKKEED